MKRKTVMSGRIRLTIALISVLGLSVAAIAFATPGAGVLSNVVSRAAFAPFRVESEDKAANFDVELKSKGLSDVVTQTIVLAPGGFSGWHSHPGPAILSIQSGTLTFYEADDPSCTPHVFAAGTGFVEAGGDVHIARNEGGENLTINVTYIIPHNAPQRIDQPMPGNCAF